MNKRGETIYQMETAFKTPNNSKTTDPHNNSLAEK